MSHHFDSVTGVNSDNPQGDPDNQQGRLEAYLI